MAEGDVLQIADGKYQNAPVSHRESFGIGDAEGSISATEIIGRMAPWPTPMYLVELHARTWVESTNDGSNYWTLTLRKKAANDDDTVIATFNTASPAGWEAWTEEIGEVFDPANHRVIDLLATKVGSPGALYWSAALVYRLGVE